jgi:hypothetical protein
MTYQYTLSKSRDHPRVSCALGRISGCRA